MERAILISIRPQWVEKILNGEKTIEIRKTMPKCELPVKVYIYCTNGKKNELLAKDNSTGKYRFWYGTYNALNGKTVAEFTLNEIETINEHECYNATCLKNHCCLTPEELTKYTKGKKFHAWHIDDLKIYDKPKDLSEFYSEKECPYKDWGDVDNIGCWECGCEMFSRGECRFGNLKLERPPQSWCYVEK